MNPDAFSSIASIERCSLTLEASRHCYIEHRSMLGSTAQGLYAIDRYTADFVAWCRLRQVTLVCEVTPEVLAEYARWLHRYRQKNGQPLAVASRLAKLIPLRGWFKWLARTRQIAFDPSQGIELPVAARSLPRHLLTLQDVEAVQGSPNLRLATGLRDRAVLELLFATGIRRMEVAGARLDDLDQQRRLLLVRCGKGRKDRMVPLGEHNVVKAVAHAYQEEEYSTLRFNFRGVERSEGDFDNGVGEQEDVKAALQTLGKKNMDLAGYPFGAWVNALGLAKFEEAQRLIMVSPPVSVIDFSFLEYHSKVKLVICGLQGTRSPNTRRLKRCCPSGTMRPMFRVIHGADHFYSGYEEDLIDIVREFLRKEKA